MKNDFFKIFIMFLLIIPIYFMTLPQPAALQADAECREGPCITPDRGFREVKKTCFGNGLECVMTFRYCPECVRNVDPDGTVWYVRMVSITGSLFDVSNEEIPKKIVERKLKVTFTYDKKSFVGLDNPEEDLDCHRNLLDDSKTIWSVAQTCELMQSDKFYGINEMFTIYKKNPKNAKMEHIENSHVTLICTVSGDIIVNVKTM